jgi:hypothetical protein
MQILHLGLQLCAVVEFPFHLDPFGHVSAEAILQEHIILVCLKQTGLDRRDLIRQFGDLVRQIRDALARNLFSVSNCALRWVICRLRSLICRSSPSLAAVKADLASTNSFENVTDVDWQVSSWLESVIAVPLKAATSVWDEDSKFEALVIAAASCSC